MLVNMCHERLRYHRKLRADKLIDYEDLKTEIVEWIAEEVKLTSRGGRAAALEQTQQCAGGDEEQEDDLDEALAQQLDEHEPLGTLSALVRKAITKAKFKGNGKGCKGKGKSNNKGKDKDRGKKGRNCYDCGSEDHLVAECPKRRARVAAGGPERLPTGGEKGAGFPSQAL